jgi:hypothetical protein
MFCGMNISNMVCKCHVHVRCIPCKEENQIVQMFVETCLDFSFKEVSEGNEQEVHSKTPTYASDSTGIVKSRWFMA